MRNLLFAAALLFSAGTVCAQIEISTLADLSNIRSDLSGNYILINDIDASATADPGYNGGDGWLPIGRHAGGISFFTGTLDGQGFTITGLTIDRPEDNTSLLVGLIARVDSNAVVANLHLTDVDIEGDTFVGGVAGGIYGSATMTNCSVSGLVRGTSSVGGLLGWQPGGTVEDCWTEGSVELIGISERGGGLIGQATSTIRRSFSTADVTGYASVGGLVGQVNSGSDIEESFATGDVTASNSGAGALVGRSAGQIVRCYATGDAVVLAGGLVSAGGLLGGLDGGVGLIDCFARGSATGQQWVGGLAGYQNDGAITRCFSTGVANGMTIEVGGLLGRQTSGTLTASYWDTDSSGTATSAGGAGAIGLTTAEMTTPFAGGAYDGWDFVNVWLEEEEANDGYPIHAWQTVRCTLTYEAGPGGSIEGDLEQVRMPGLSGTMVTAVPDNIGFEFIEWSDGSTDNPRTDLKVMGDLTVTANFVETGIIPISTLGDLDNIRNDLTGNFALVNDVDASATADPEYNGGEGWLPIGRVEGGVVDFRGSFDGQGFTISGLTFNRPATGGETGTVAGLFGGLGDPSAISNLHLVEVDFLGDDRVGGIAGHMRVLSSVTNCSVSGRIRGQTRVGGLIAYQFGGLIENCWTEGEVETSGVNQQVGGLVGYTINGTMRRSYSTSDVSGSTWVGGLVGRMDGEYTMEECFATGNVSGASSIVGGLAGDQSGLIDRCYATGNVTSVGAGIVSFGGLVGSQNSGAELRDSFARGSVTGPILLGGAVGHQNGGAIIRIFTTGSVNGNSEVGGILGRQTSGTVTASYWDTDSSGNATSAGGAGAIGLTTAEMTTPFGGGAYTGWDFVDVWLEEEEANDGYPIHQWQTVRHTLQYAAGSGGSLEGDLEQVRIPGLRGTAVTALPNEGFEFLKWSDDSTENPRQDVNVTSNVDVTAIFIDPNAVPSVLMIY